MLESLSHLQSCFVTLTYNNENWPYKGQVSGRDTQLWIKRLRKKFSARKIRYYAVGEYGDKNGRPHYHFILFGIGQSEFPMSVFKIKKDGSYWGTSNLWNTQYEYVHLGKWKKRKWWNPIKGYLEVGSVTKDSCQYVSGYVLKKLTKKEDPRLLGRNPEFCRMSRNQGIGVSAMDVVANACSKTHVLSDETVDVPDRLRHSGKLWPLGGFLKNKLRIMMWKDKKLLIDLSKRKRVADVEESFEGCLTATEKCCIPLQQAILTERSVNEADAFIKKHKIYSKERSL